MLSPRTFVQNSRATLDEAVAAVQRLLDRQDGPMVLVAHSFSGMIVTEAGVDPKGSSLVCCGTRPGCRRGLHRIRQKVPTPPASAGIVFDGMAKRMNAKTIEIKASHLALVSQPDVITDLIVDAAGRK